MMPGKQVTSAIRKVKIKQLTRSIRKSLYLGKSEEDEKLNKLFKPALLNEIVHQSKAKTRTHI